MRIDPSEHDSRRIYYLMMSSVTPRPIAWVSTLSRDGVPNLAPFSFYNAVTSKPPLLSVAISRRRKQRKDTALNASSTGEFVVNVVTERHLDAMVQSSADYPPEVDEFEKAGVVAAPSELVRPPRVAEAPIAMECRTREIFEVSPGIVDLLIGEVVLFHVADDLPIDEDLHIPAAALGPIGRLGGQDYAPLGTVVQRPRPDVR
ncbi:MAG: flavin reductase family protein [Deltaproteobacteria bacterium]|nr:flavin reductase family protein [Deltaproteobacteria bacterium]MBW2537905.1 flavin reductase family protein [Deltaproteobacteria bacterium]